MSDIQRYLRCGRSGDMIPDSHGAWCKYDEIERLRRLLRWIRDGGAKDDDPDMWRQVDEALGDH